MADLTPEENEDVRFNTLQNAYKGMGSDDLQLVINWGWALYIIGGVFGTISVGMLFAAIQDTHNGPGFIGWMGGLGTMAATCLFVAKRLQTSASNLSAFLAEAEVRSRRKR